MGETEKDKDEDKEKDKESDSEKAEKKLPSSVLARARSFASPYTPLIILGSIGAIMSGGIFPVWGVLFAETIDLLFRGVLPCTEDNIPFPDFNTCEEYWTDFADSMRDRSF